MSKLYSIMELLSVFLLAIEAIKLDNLSWVKYRTLKASRFINPKIQFVNELPHDDTLFRPRYVFELFLTTLYCIGLSCLLVGLHFYEMQLSELIPESLIVWFIAVIGAVFLPLIVGVVLYSSLLYIMSLVVYCLQWIERNTRTGIVGILGFVLFAIQFFGN